MFSSSTKRLIWATFLQLSGILGAGIFVLPYAFKQSNFIFATFGLIILTLIVVQLNLFYVDIVLATKGDHQLSGYAQIYFGRRLKILALINLFILGMGALFAYIKLSSDFITTIIPSLSPNLATAIFFVVISFFHLVKLPGFKDYYKIIPPLAILIVMVLISIALQVPSYPTEFVLPSWTFFGPLVFALTGFTIIPEIEEYLRPFSHKRQQLKDSTIYGQLISAVLYFFFAFAIIQISGPFLTSDVVTGVNRVLPLLARFLSFLGLILIFEASLNFLLMFKETFYRDFSFSQSMSYFLSFLVFAFSFLFIKAPLLTIVSVTGSVTIFVSALIICLIRLKIQRSPKVIIKALIILLVFFFGLLTELN